jgi:hypothetical protein
MRLRFLDTHRSEITFRKPRMGGGGGGGDLMLGGHHDRYGGGGGGGGYGHFGGHHGGHHHGHGGAFQHGAFLRNRCVDL